MDTKVLRQKILDLAIRGKLVPQDPNDEPASVLLERIRQQKQQMVKEGKLKPKDIKNDSAIFVGEDNLHYEKFADGSVKCIEDEIPFDLPEGWAWAFLSNIVYVLNGDRGQSYPAKSKLRSKGIPFVSASNIQDGVVSSDGLLCLSDSQYDALGAGKLFAGDIVYCIRGSLGKCGLFTMEKGAIASSLVIVRSLFDAPHIIDYIFLYLNSALAAGEIKKYDNGSAQPNLAAKDFRHFLVPLPPQAEMQRINKQAREALVFVKRIQNNKDELHAAIAVAKAKILDLAIRGQLVPQDPSDEPASVLLEHIRAEKEELIRQGKIKRDKKESVIFRGEDNSYYEKMADGKLHCLDDQLPFELPDGWEWCNLSMIGTTNIGLTYRPTDIEPGGIMVLRSCNIVNDQVDLSGLVRVKTTVRENRFAQKNDILICARNGSRSLVGKCALIPDLREPASFGAFMAIYRTEYFEFIVHYLRSSFFRSVFDDSNSTAINQLTQDMLKRAIVPLPPLSEQRRIVEAIGAMLFELNQIEKSLS